MQDIASIVGGGTPSTGNLAFWKGGDIPWITPADLSGYGQKTISRGARNITRLGLERSGAMLLPSGAVLFSSRAPIGYVAIASNPVSTNQGFKSFVLEPGITPDYVYYYLQFSKPLALSLASGTTFQEISGRNARLIPVVVAPVDEQPRIVEAIESYLSRLDEAVDSLERVQAKLKAYRASVLKAAVEGRLVPTEASLARAKKRAYEPADTLLARILKERRRSWEETEVAKLKAAGRAPKDDKWKGKYNEPVAPDMSALPELPEGWSWATLDQLLAEPLTNGKSVPDGTGVPVLRLTCIKSGRVDLTERKTGDWNDIDPQKFFVKADDFLIIRGNGSIHLVGRGGRVSAAPNEVAYPDTLIRARIDPAALYPPLLSRWWDSPPVRRHIERRAKTTAGIYKVNQTDLGQTPVPLAPMLEQTRIYDELERFDTTAIAATATIEAGVRHCSRLRQAVLKWAFEGKLVDQDPTDEPAEKLLARIRAARAAVSPVRKTLGRRARGSA
jgi:type I restriction enzyme, S subunit